MRLHIQVTDNDIKRGQPSIPRSCPVALSIKRKLPPGFFCSVVGTEIYLGKGWKSTDIIDAPKSVSRFVTNFDNYNDVKPFGFYLEVPDWMLK